MKPYIIIAIAAYLTDPLTSWLVDYRVMEFIGGML